MLEKMMPTQERANELYLGKVVTFTAECYRNGSLSGMGNPTLEWVVVGCCPLPISNVPPDKMVSVDVVSLYDYKVVHLGNFQTAAETCDSYTAGAEEISTIKPLT